MGAECFVWANKKYHDSYVGICMYGYKAIDDRECVLDVDVTSGNGKNAVNSQWALLGQYSIIIVLCRPTSPTTTKYIKIYTIYGFSEVAEVVGYSKLWVKQLLED